ncbi:glycosyltransferase [Pedobacter nototheniae]|uniref:glycosyltransferase n=1 Tax=Pedobacter nototheniae TaxID=2488994 RepID=UPI00292FBA3A|nr:glycosyltransferase [Pedobacter nototheniae]
MGKLLFLSSLLPNKNKSFFISNSLGAISNANDSLQRALLDGFKQNLVDVYALNVPNIGAFPFKFKKVKSIGFKFDNTDALVGYNIDFYNINLLKHFSIQKNLNNYITKNKHILSGVDYVFVYDLYTPFLKALKLIKSINPNCKIIVMIPDIIGFTHSNKGFLHRQLEENNRRTLANAKSEIDGFVYLTKSMGEMLPLEVNNKPFIVIEGVLNPQNKIYKKNINVSNKVIFYSGSLDLRHGIMNLIEAFLLSKNKDIELHVCGDGDGKGVMLEKIKNISTIKYLGQIAREEVIKKQSEAFLLINPRSSKGEFTKYSFPSKVIEYYLSGTATFMYRLQGIPEEYFDYCFSLEDESINALSNFFDDLENMQIEEMLEMGRMARSFVVETKNAKVQTEKIIKFTNSL